MVVESIDPPHRFYFVGCDTPWQFIGTAAVMRVRACPILGASVDNYVCRFISMHCKSLIVARTILYNTILVFITTVFYESWYYVE